MAGVPVAVTLAGGYAFRVEDTVMIHCNTVHAAAEALLATVVLGLSHYAWLAAKKGLGATVNHSLLYDPQVKKALDAVRSGALGNVVSVDILRGSEYPPYEGGPLPPWYRSAGYAYRDLAIHCMYLVQELLGPIEEVEGEWRSLGGDPNLAYDEWRTLVRCKRGLGQFQLTWNVKPMQSQMIIHGTKGVFRIDLFAMFHGKRASTPLPKAAERLVNAFADSIQPLIDVPIGVWKFVRKEVQAYQGLRDLVADFYRRLAAGDPPPVSVSDATITFRDGATGRVQTAALGSNSITLGSPSPRRSTSHFEADC